MVLVTGASSGLGKLVVDAVSEAFPSAVVYGTSRSGWQPPRKLPWSPSRSPRGIEPRDDDGERLTDGLCPRPQRADEAAEVMHGVGLASSSKVGSEDGGGETERQGACALAGSMARAQQAAWRGSLG